MPILLALALAAPLFSGCARHGDGGEPAASDALNAPTRGGASEEVKKATPLAAADIENNLQPSEGDIAIESEIKALERSGKWGTKDKEQPAKEGGLDMSKYDFPVVLNNQVAAYLDIFQGEQHEMFERWLARSTKYLPIIRREFAKAGLPQDLAYLSMIESGYTPTAQSAAGAVGLWQFMRDTGKHYTLRIDNYVDERRHIEKSTKAAVNMLGELYKDFGDWHLAVAAYNSGPARVQNGLSRFAAKTFWELADEQYLPLETKRYVPKLIAAIIIAKDPKKYGFDDVSYQREFNYDRLTVTPGLTFDAVALVAGCDLEAIKSLNPELHRGVIPPGAGRYVVRIPAGSKDLASRNLALLHTVRDTKYHHYTVKGRENITMVCKRYGISRTSLLKTNNLHSARLTPGRTLLIPYTVTSYALGGRKVTGIDDNDTTIASAHTVADTPATSGPVNISAGPRTARKGDALTAIPQKYQINQDDLLAFNGKPSAKELRIDQRMKAGQAKQPAETPRIAKDRQAIKKIARLENLKAGIAATPRDEAAPIVSRISLKTRKIKEPVNGPNGPLLVKIDKTIVKQDRDHIPDWYLVKDGETLWSIAKKHNVSLDQIKKWNNLKSSAIHAGLRLKIREA